MRILARGVSPFTPIETITIEECTGRVVCEMDNNVCFMYSQLKDIKTIERRVFGDYYEKEECNCLYSVCTLSAARKEKSMEKLTWSYIWYPGFE